MAGYWGGKAAPSRIWLDGGELEKGLICDVNAIKLGLTLIHVYCIKSKAYYFFNFRVLGS